MMSLINNIVAFDDGLGDDAAELAAKEFLKGLEEGMWVNSSCIQTSESLQHLINTLDIDAPFNELPLSWQSGAVPPLHAFALDNLIDHVSLLLDHGIDMEERDNSNRTALHIAAQEGVGEIVTMLLDRDAETNVRDEYGCSPLHRTAWHGHLDISTLLIQHGAEVSAMNHSSIKPIEWAIVRNQPEIFDLLMSNGATLDNFKIPPILEVVRRGYLLIFNRLSGLNEDLFVTDQRGNSLLHIAILNGSDEIAQLIIQHFAATDNTKIDAMNDEKTTALILAAQKSNLSIVELLLSAGANPNIVSPNDRKSALHFTLHGRNVLVIKTLLDHGANVNHQNVDGDSLLHLVLQNQYLSVVKLLMGHDVNKFLANNAGKTPQSIAENMSIDL